jgi:peptidyl-prolyl cis-trans isomerase A (cyclophilin A)
MALLGGCAAPGTTLVRVATDLGVIDIALQTEAAPITCANFLRYVDAKMYDGGRFHRAVRLDNQSRSDIQIEVVQAGTNRARRGDGFGAIKLERNSVTGLKHVDGTISMARSGPDDATSDFFVCVGPQPSLDFGGKRNADGQGFAAFGRVVAGMDVVRKIQNSRTRGENLRPAIRINTMRRVPK